MRATSLVLPDLQQDTEGLGEQDMSGCFAPTTVVVVVGPSLDIS